MNTDIKAPLQDGISIRWNKRAEYKLGKLEDPPSFQDLKREDHRFFSAICDFIWAMQVAPIKLKSPEEVAELIDNDNLPGVVKSVVDAILEATPDLEKKSSENNSPSPESS